MTIPGLSIPASQYSFETSLGFEMLTRDVTINPKAETQARSFYRALLETEIPVRRALSSPAKPSPILFVPLMTA
jgi:hypothetical protein